MQELIELSYTHDLIDELNLLNSLKKLNAEQEREKQLIVVELKKRGVNICI